MLSIFLRKSSVLMTNTAVPSTSCGTPLLRKLAEKKGVHYACEASGHQSDRYLWRYVRAEQQTLAEAIDKLE
jgi:hypothetical protein